MDKTIDVVRVMEIMPTSNQISQGNLVYLIMNNYAFVATVNKVAEKPAIQF